MTVQSLYELHYNETDFALTVFNTTGKLDYYKKRCKWLKSKDWSTKRVLKYLKLKKLIPKIERKRKKAKIERDYLRLVIKCVYEHKYFQLRCLGAWDEYEKYINTFNLSPGLQNPT